MPTYPLTLPTELEPTSGYLRKQHTVARSNSPFTYQSQTFEHAGERWLIDLEFAPVNNIVSSLTAWAVLTVYVTGDKRSTGGVNYEALSNHTSDASSFQTDYDAGKWKRIEIYAAIGFYQDIKGLLGSFNLDVSPYDESVSGDTTKTFELVANQKPGWKKNKGNIYTFDKLICQEAL